MFNVDDQLHGFVVTRVRDVKALNSTLVEMTHMKTGAELCFHNNGDINKLFSVTFKTIPENDTGVFHILEHSVLCGSKKYPVKEPFVELLKSSLNTFLNAMTFSDKTMYPVSSRNTKDYLNLMSVYLDAVFAPDILTNPYIFAQEGCHIELNEDGNVYKGVVLNEMKGAMSDVEEVMRQGVNRLLFGPTCYGFNSGGEPSSIINLTYEQFVEMYKRFYHPSNARFFIDGDVPLDETLAMIDSYLSQYDQADLHITIPDPQPLDNRELTQYYEVEDGDDAKAQLSIGKIIGGWQDMLQNMMQGIIVDVLTGSNEAPLAKALLDANLVEDLELEVDDTIANTVTIVHCRNIDPDNVQAIKALIKKTVEEIYDRGLDHEMIQASINQLSFKLRTPGEPQGLMRAILAMNSWLHGGDPLTYLVYNDVIKQMREQVETGAYEELMMKMLIEDDQTVTVLTLPSTSLGEETRAFEQKHLDNKLAHMSDDDLNALNELNDNLIKWQSTPDTLEQLSTLPVLTLDEVNPEPEKAQSNESEYDGVKVLHRVTKIEGVIHLRYYFDCSDYSLPELTKIALMTQFLEEMPTTTRDALTLQKDIKSVFGRLNFTIRSFLNNKDSANGKPYVLITASLLEENLEAGMAIIDDIIHNTIFDQGRMSDILKQLIDDGKQLKIMSGHSLGMMDTLAHYDARNAIQKALAGLDMINYLDSLDFSDDMFTDMISFFNDVREKVFVKNRLFFSYSATHELKDELSLLLDIFKSGTPVAHSYKYVNHDDLMTEITIPAGIGYAVKGYHLKEAGLSYDGSLSVAANIISLSYLWNVVRVQGGAYGTGLSAGLSGTIATYSYRDPSPLATLDAYKGMSEFLRGFVESEEEIDKYIISTIATTEPLMAEVVKGLRSDESYITGYRYEDAVRFRKEMLSTTKEDLLKWCDLLDRLSNEGATCLVGNTAMLEKDNNESEINA